MTLNTAEPHPVQVRARRVWDDLAARAIQQPQRQGHAIDEAELVERVSEELGAMEQEWALERAELAEQVADELGDMELRWALERAALVAQIEDLQQRVPALPRPSFTPEVWAARVRAQGRPLPEQVVTWRGEALRRLAAIGITASDITIVRLADAVLCNHK